MESLLEARGHEGPGGEVAGLVEVGHTVVVLGVVLVEEVVDIGLLGWVGDVDLGLREATRHIVRIGAEGGWVPVQVHGGVPVGVSVVWVVGHGPHL